ncbi:MAG: MFS transporter [Armatimonadetes bacterium]|nr:MFS transporter [Armatimonadota bacterium]
MIESRRDAAAVVSLVMGWMFLSGMIGTGMIGPNRSSIEGEYGVSHTLFGLTVALIQIGSAAGVLLAAPRLRRFPRVNLLMGGLAFQVAGFVSACATRSVWGAVAGWTLITLDTILKAITNSISARLWADNPRKGVTLLHGSNGIGKVFGPLIAFACLFFYWRWSFAAVGVITALVLLALFARYRSFNGLGAQENREPSRADRAVLKRPFYWLCVMPFGMISGGELAFVTLLPLFCEKQKDMSPEAASLMLTVHLTGLAAGRFISALSGGKASNATIIAVCLSSGLFAALALLTDSILLRAACLFFCGGPFSSTWPTYYAQVSRLLTGHREMLDFGSSLSNTVGISICIFASSKIVDINLMAAILFGPAVLWLFGILFYLGPYLRG